MYEHHRQPLAKRSRFYKRVLRLLGVALGLDILAVLFGAVGYHFTEGLNWLDACLEGTMVITGNGPTIPLHTSAGKVFAIADALVGVIVFVTVIGVVLTPLFHRVLHTFNVDVPPEGSGESEKK